MLHEVFHNLHDHLRRRLRTHVAAEIALASMPVAHDGNGHSVFNTAERIVLTRLARVLMTLTQTMDIYTFNHKKL